MNKTRFVSTIAPLLLLAAIGCDNEPSRLAEASRQLVAADATARTEVIALQRDLQQGQTNLGRQRDQLESDRREFAEERNRDPIVANTILSVGTLLACLLPLVLCLYLVMGLRGDPRSDSTLTDILVQEIVADQPTLLPLSRPLPAISDEIDRTDEQPTIEHADAA